ncbi:MAG: hypothetical protein C5B51_14805 [Terriglobia bacterium]|nr:MAG: hypothetical protein C5B51_14805 [Terriglobia bacterium]
MNHLDFCTVDDGRGRSVDLSLLRRSQRTTVFQTRTAVLTRPARHDRDVISLLQPFFASTEANALVPRRPAALSKVRGSGAHLGLVAPDSVPVKRKTPKPVRFQTLPERRYAVGDQETEVPYGLPRFLNAVTLKAMLGAKNAALLRKIGEQWEVCPDSFQVDLEDASQVFRLGEVTVYS